MTPEEFIFYVKWLNSQAYTLWVWALLRNAMANELVLLESITNWVVSSILPFGLLPHPGYA